MANPKNSLRRSKRAFSLIELSIVLIIIGLLVAGVTGGASLINSATLRSVMNEARGYSVAVNSFYVKYEYYPGDYPTAIGTSGVGNNNKQIEYVNLVASATDNNRLESNIAWAQLKNEGIIDSAITFASGNLTTGATVALTAGTNIPGSKLKSAGWVFDYVSTQNVVTLTGNVAAVSGMTVAAANLVPTGVLSPSDASSIDSKLDDNDPSLGKVRSWTIGAFNGGSAASAPASSCYFTDTSASNKVKYSTAVLSKNCALTFQVDINN